MHVHLRVLFVTQFSKTNTDPFLDSDILERWKIAGLNRKLQIKPKKWETITNENGETKERCKSVQLILKWVRLDAFSILYRPARF